MSVPPPIFVQPTGWTSYFPVDFRYPVYSKSELEKAAQDAKVRISNDRPAYDPEGILARSKARNLSAAQLLLDLTTGPDNKHKALGPGWNEEHYFVPEIHARYPEGGRDGNGVSVRETATGTGLTWVAPMPPANPHFPFKNLYTCFEGRNIQNETSKGLPSGGGFHEIGDAAETIINSVEEAPVIVGMATGVPWPTPPDNGEFAWGLTDVVTVRWLMPGEGLVTPAGDQTWAEDAPWRPRHDQDPLRGTGADGGRNYHWFIFQHDRFVCTQEWVHNCIPKASNFLGLKCE
ncbi:hypothetical protein EBZ80_26270 [bacterium]|nr:hypothetical protein [bacterium]